MVIILATIFYWAGVHNNWPGSVIMIHGHHSTYVLQHENNAMHYFLTAMISRRLVCFTNNWHTRTSSLHHWFSAGLLELWKSVPSATDRARYAVYMYLVTPDWNSSLSEPLVHRNWKDGFD